MSIKLEPLKDRVLVRLRPVPERTGSILRVQHDQSARWADVVAVGPEVRDIQPSMGVLVNPLAGQSFGEDIMLSEDAILATE